MKKEYRALFKQYGYPDRWLNAGAYCEDCIRRVFSTREEAENAIKHVKELFPDCARTETTKAGCFGVSTRIDTDTAHKLAVSETMIEVREVTEWKAV